MKLGKKIGNRNFRVRNDWFEEVEEFQYVVVMIENYEKIIFKK